MESSRITTSFLCSTSRLAFSITISATCTWRVAGSSKVEATTSPFTVRVISVTSSGRSSIRSTITTTSGWLVGFDGVAGVQVEAPDLRGRHVDVVGAGEVRGVRGAQEAEAVLEHFQRAIAEDGFALLRLVLQEREDQLLLAKAVGTLELVGVRHVD